MKFKLDENLSPSLAAIFAAAGHDAHSVTEQNLNGQPDDRVIDICNHERRALVTLDLDFSDILAYPPAQFSEPALYRMGRSAETSLSMNPLSRRHSGTGYLYMPGTGKSHIQILRCGIGAIPAMAMAIRCQFLLNRLVCLIFVVRRRVVPVSRLE